jgi:hypothetical protein
MGFGFFEFHFLDGRLSINHGELKTIDQPQFVPLPSRS